MCRKVPKAMFTDSDHIALAGFLVEAGRMGEAPALAAEAAAVLPGISIQGWTGHPGWLKAGRGRAIAQMHAAAFPACASQAGLARGAVKQPSLYSRRMDDGPVGRHMVLSDNALGLPSASAGNGLLL